MNPVLDALIDVCLWPYSFDEVRVEAVMAAAGVARDGGDAAAVRDAALGVKARWGDMSLDEGDA